MEQESDGDANYNWCTWYSHQRLGGLGNKRTRGYHPNYRITNIGQNTEESPDHLRTLDVTQTPVRNHRLTLAWKTRKGITIIIHLGQKTRPYNNQKKKKKREFAKLSTLLSRLTTE